MYDEEDLQHRMQDLLREKWRDRRNTEGFHIRRREVEALCPDPETAAQLFVVSRDHLWQGDYHTGNKHGWLGAWVTWVRA